MNDEAKMAEHERLTALVYDESFRLSLTFNEDPNREDIMIALGSPDVGIHFHVPKNLLKEWLAKIDAKIKELGQ